MRCIKARLERAERLVKGTTLSADVSIIRETVDGWQVDFGLWDGNPGGGRTVTSYHNTEAEAEAAANKLLEKYSGMKDHALIVIDV